jgi:NADH-quinone oxidoreductase subunit C
LLTQSKDVNTDILPSVSDLFYSANWLEREVSELYGNIFIGKKDLRNLMLPYGDSSYPFQKSFPTIGLTEILYDSNLDTIIQNPIILQL